MDTSRAGTPISFWVAALDKAEAEESVLGADGRISVEGITQNDPNLRDALFNGLLRTVLDESVERLYPQLANLIQRPRQAGGQVQNEEPIFQIANEIQELAASMEKGGKKASFNQIEQIVLQSEPKHPDDVPKICSFANCTAAVAISRTSTIS